MVGLSSRVGSWNHAVDLESSSFPTVHMFQLSCYDIIIYHIMIAIFRAEKDKQDDILLIPLPVNKQLDTSNKPASKPKLTPARYRYGRAAQRLSSYWFSAEEMYLNICKIFLITVLCRSPARPAGYVNETIIYPSIQIAIHRCYVSIVTRTVRAGHQPDERPRCVRGCRHTCEESRL